MIYDWRAWLEKIFKYLKVFINLTKIFYSENICHYKKTQIYLVTGVQDSPGDPSHQLGNIPGALSSLPPPSPTERKVQSRSGFGKSQSKLRRPEIKYHKDILTSPRSGSGRVYGKWNAEENEIKYVGISVQGLAAHVKFSKKPSGLDWLTGPWLDKSPYFKTFLQSCKI